MKKILMAVILAAMAAIPARAQLSGCQYTAGSWQLQKIRATASGSQIIGCINATFEALSSSVPVAGSTSAYNSFGWLAANRISGQASGAAGIHVSSYTWFTSSAAITGGGGLAVTYGITSGSSVVLGSSTASSFWGDGSHLTGVVEQNTYTSSKTITANVKINPAYDTNAYIEGTYIAGIPRTYIKSKNDSQSAYQLLYIDGNALHLNTQSGAATTVGGSLSVTGAASASNLSGTNTGDQTSVTGNAGTATALAANGGNCSAGSYPLGVDASGASESCTAAPVVSTATVIRDYNGNATVPYGVVAATGSFSGSVTASSVTVRGTNAPLLLDSSAGNYPKLSFSKTGTEIGFLQADSGEGNISFRPTSGANGIYVKSGGAADGFVGIGTASPATKLYMSSGVFTLDGTTPGIAFPTNGTPSNPALVGSDADSGLFFGGSGFNAKSVVYAQDGVGKQTQFGLNYTFSGSGRIYADASLALGYNNTDDLTIDTSHNVTLSKNIFISSSAGVGQGISLATMSVTGTLFFASTTTVSGSTCTVGGATVVNFSTYTLPGGLASPGDAVVVECAFKNSAAAPTSPVFRTQMVGLGSNEGGIATVSVNTALQIVRTRTTIMNVRAGHALVSGEVWANTNGGNSTAPTWTDSGGNTGGAAFDWTTSHVIKCAAEENGGGPINFLWMKVSKQ